VKLSDYILLHETILDQVRLHHVIFMDKKVLAAITWTKCCVPASDLDDVFSPWQQTFSHDTGKMDPASMSCTHTAKNFLVHDCKPCTHTAKKAYKQSSMDKMHLDSSRSDFSPLHIDLDLDLEKRHPNHEKERRMRVGERESTYCGALSTNPRAKLLPLRNGQFLGFGAQNPQKWRRSYGKEGWVRLYL
jgi:hypothetical protein